MLASVVDDVDSVVDRELRVRLPVRSFLLVAAGAAVLATALLPAAGWSSPGTCAVGGGAAYLLARAGPARAERTSSRPGRCLSERVVEVTQVAAGAGHVAGGRGRARRGGGAEPRLTGCGGAGGRVAGDRPGPSAARRRRGVGVTALVAAPAAATGSLSGPVLALLVLLPACPGRRRPAAGRGRAPSRPGRGPPRSACAALESATPAVVRPGRAAPAPPATTVGADGRVGAGWDGTAVLRTSRCGSAGASGSAVVGPSGSGKSTLASLMLRFVDPWHGRVALGGVPVRGLALDDVRRRSGSSTTTRTSSRRRSSRTSASRARTAADDEVEAALRQARLGAWLDEPARRAGHLAG